MTPDTHHAISYVELGVTDLVATRAFYESAFGWEFNDYGGAYAGIKSVSGNGEIGGLNPQAEPNAAGPLVLIYSTDLEATLTAVTQAGGTIEVAPYDYPGGSRFEFVDPSGNRLGVFTQA